jgi:hypothetical protein
MTTCPMYTTALLVVGMLDWCSDGRIQATLGFLMRVYGQYVRRATEVHSLGALSSCYLQPAG